MEEKRNISWANLFIKVILVIIFVLFTVWLLSLSNKGLSDSLDVLKNDIFAQNMERMKEVGKEYFTIERLPEKVGSVETLTLKKMYDKKLILELTDKNGNACSAENSYVSIEKYDNEYQMKVYLECGEESDYIMVIMGCYDYCDTDICELKDVVKTTEYEYKKSTGGYWTDYGKWSEWSKVSVTKTDYRQVETKIEKEAYSYDKIVTEIDYVEFNAECPSGYKLTSDKTKCYKTVNEITTTKPICPAVSGYTNTGRDGFTCSYSKTVVDTITKTAVCPSGYTKSGNDCIKSTTSTADPICPSKSGYTYIGRDGFTCNYKSKTNFSKGDYVKTETGSYVPSDNSKYVYEQIDADYVYSCNGDCAFHWVYTYKIYKSIAKTVTDTASCPSGYTKSGNTCVKSASAIEKPVCPLVTGYTNVGRNGFTCNYSKNTTVTTTKVASCPTGYSKLNNECSKTVTTNVYKDLVYTCPTGYSKTEDGSKCYKNVNFTVKVTGTKDVTYYRYRVREYVGGSVDYKWSTSKEDKRLLDSGYKLTGRTR